VAKYVLKDAYIAINGTVVSNLASSCELTDEAEQIDFTGFSTNGYREIGPGLKTAEINVTFFSDFAAAGVNSGINNIIQPIYSSGGTCGIEIRPTSAAVSATNPKGTMLARVYSYSGIAGAVGDASTFDCGFLNAGTAGLVWGTT